MLFFCIVNVALLTVGIVGVPVKSEYAPLVATVANVGLFKICATPETAFQSEFTCAAGMLSVTFPLESGEILFILTTVPTFVVYPFGLELS